MKALLCFVSAHLPSPNSKQAGQKIAYNHLLWLSEKYRIILIAYMNPIEAETYKEEDFSFCEEIIIVKINYQTRFINVLKNINIPFFISFRYSKKIKERINDLYSLKEKVVFWFEYVQMCQYIPNMRKENKFSIIVCHDILVQMFERRVEKSKCLKWLYLIEKNRIFLWEKEYLKKCNKIITLSNKDCNLLEKKYGIKDSIACYPKLNYCGDGTNKHTVGSRLIIFFGAMNRMENEDAVNWFVKYIFDDILKIYPETKLMIVGSSPTNNIIEMGKKKNNIIITGFVENPYEIFSNAWFSIAPLQFGAGIKLKVLECLAFGLPVISTTIGAEGIEADRENGLIIADGKKIYTQECIFLLEDKEICLELGTKSKKWFNEVYLSIQETKEKINKIVDF